MIDLIHCPFCGSTDVYVSLHSSNPSRIPSDTVAHGQCQDCFMIGPASAHSDPQEAKRMAMEAWNTRAPDPALAELETWLLEQIRWHENTFHPPLKAALAKLRELKGGNEKGEQ